MSLKKLLNKKSAKELGVSLVEYVLLAVLIAVVSIAAIRSFGQNVSSMYSESNEALET